MNLILTTYSLHQVIFNIIFIIFHYIYKVESIYISVDFIFYFLSFKNFTKVLLKIKMISHPKKFSVRTEIQNDFSKNLFAFNLFIL